MRGPKGPISYVRNAPHQVWSFPFSLPHTVTLRQNVWYSEDSSLKCLCHFRISHNKRFCDRNPKVFNRNRSPVAWQQTNLERPWDQMRTSPAKSVQCTYMEWKENSDNNKKCYSTWILLWIKMMEYAKSRQFRICCEQSHGADIDCCTLWVSVIKDKGKWVC